VHKLAHKIVNVASVRSLNENGQPDYMTNMD